MHSVNHLLRVQVLRLKLIIMVRRNENAVALVHFDTQFVDVAPERVLFDVGVEEIDWRRVDGFDRVGQAREHVHAVVFLKVYVFFAAGDFLSEDVRDQHNGHLSLNRAHKLLRFFIMWLFVDYGPLHQFNRFKPCKIVVEFWHLEVFSDAVEFKLDVVGVGRFYGGRLFEDVLAWQLLVFHILDEFGVSHV